jgi:GAF domain-containing protein
VPVDDGNPPAGPKWRPRFFSDSPVRHDVNVNEQHPPQAVLDDGLLAIASLTRALGGTAQLADVGSLLWALIRQIVPCDAMALFLPDESHDHVVVRFAAGTHAHALRGVTRPMPQGVAGWVAVNRATVLNAEPILDLGFCAVSNPALRSSLVTALIDSDAVIAVLALYSKELLAFTDDHVRVIELLAPRLAGSMIDAVIADEDSLYPAMPRKIASLRLVKSS